MPVGLVSPLKTKFNKWVGVEYEQLLPESKVVKKLRKVNQESFQELFKVLTIVTQIKSYKELQ